jgi:trehalose 6-phosphate synthase
LTSKEVSPEMAPELTIALVSNRGPVSFVDSADGGFELKRGAGGLAGALDPVARGLGDRAIWIAAATSETDRRAAQAGEVKRVHDVLGYRFALLDIAPEMYEAYYDRVSNRMLWFANHCLWDEVGVDKFDAADEQAWHQAYEPVNERFAQTIAESVAPESLILFQDYHLSTAPQHLRKRQPDRTISHFTHSSFCEPEKGLGRLPNAIGSRVIEGMLGADLIGFHIARWARNFLSCCETIGAEVDHDNAEVKFKDRGSFVRCYPIQIDAAELRARAKRSEVRSWAKQIREWAGDARLITRIDRIEPSKNLVRGFEAFGSLLDRRPDLRGTVRFVACVYPSRESMEEYQEYARRVEATVEDLNSRHPGSVRLFAEDDFDRSLAAQLTYDVLIVNPLMDGMNLVSKEGPALNEANGVLVLSQGAGSFDELREHALVIEDAMDVEATAKALEDALELPPDRRTELSNGLRKAVEDHPPEDWIGAQIRDLESIRDLGRPVTGPPT